MNYEVTTTKGKIRISEPQSGLTILTSEQEKAETALQTAFMLATLYAAKGGFTPVKYYLFELLTGADLEELRLAVDFFFRTILETELYVKEVPKNSLLFPQESTRLFSTNTIVAA